MKDYNLKRRNSENVVNSLPLPLTQKDLSLVNLARVKHERSQESHCEEHALKFIADFFEAV